MSKTPIFDQLLRERSLAFRGCAPSIFPTPSPREWAIEKSWLSHPSRNFPQPFVPLEGVARLSGRTPNLGEIRGMTKTPYVPRPTDRFTMGLKVPKDNLEKKKFFGMLYGMEPATWANQLDEEV